MMQGPQSSADASIAIGSLRARMRSCAIDAATNDPDTHGDVQLELAIDAQGVVTHVNASPQGNALAQSVVACMRGSARSVTFVAGAARTVRVLVRVERRPW
jgi:hypothetical protein